MNEPEVFSRRAEKLAKEALADTRVVVLNGARQVGKSTLAHLLISQTQVSAEFYLDEQSIREAVKGDLAGTVRTPGLVMIDEVQRIPELLLEIKAEVDRNPRPGRFLLTGSARLLALRDIPDSLPGRSETIELWPLSQGEIESEPDGFIDAVFLSAGTIRCPETSATRADYVLRALRGGYPEAVHRTDPRRRSRFFASYIDDLIARDVKQVSDIERPDQMRKLITVVAAQMAGLTIAESMARDVDLPRQTLRRYLELLELVYLIQRIPAWSSNLTKRAVSTPKLMMVDSGIAGYLLGITADVAGDILINVGPLLENFVLGELLRQLTWSGQQVRLFHYRDRDGAEVDAILEHTNGRIVAIEVKAAESVRAGDFRAINKLAGRLGDRFHAGYVVYCGTQSLSFGKKIAAIPMASLWKCAPS